MKFIRWFLGRLILTINFLTPPRSIERDPDVQKVIDAKTAKMALYQFEACPFCVKVRRFFKRQALNIELRDAKNNAVFKDELTQQGGKHQAPCLRIEDEQKNVTWLYESKDIIAFLNAEFGLV